MSSNKKELPCFSTDTPQGSYGARCENFLSDERILVTFHIRYKSFPGHPPWWNLSFLKKLRWPQSNCEASMERAAGRKPLHFRTQMSGTFRHLRRGSAQSNASWPRNSLLRTAQVVRCHWKWEAQPMVTFFRLFGTLQGSTHGVMKLSHIDIIPDNRYILSSCQVLPQFFWSESVCKRISQAMTACKWLAMFKSYCAWNHCRNWMKWKILAIQTPDTLLLFVRLFWSCTSEQSPQLVLAEYLQFFINHSLHPKEFR